MNLRLAASKFSTPHLAYRIELLFRSRLTWWLHALLLLDERHERTSFATAAIAEPPRSHFQTDPARARTFGPLAPYGGLAKRVAADLRQNHVVVAFFFSPEINTPTSDFICMQIYLAINIRKILYLQI